MGNYDEVLKAIFGTCAEIARRERTKALNSNNYSDALAAAFLEGTCKQIANAYN